MSGPSAVFGRASTKRFAGIREGNAEREDAATSRENGEHVPKSKAELKVRLVQHEIAEKEACKMIQGLCQELSVTSRVEMGGTSYDNIHDLLSGILLLGNLCKRIVHAKNEMEASLESFKGEFQNLEQSKNAAIEQLEGVILRLQAENFKGNDAITELNTKHNHKVTLMQKEMFTLKETINELKAENEKLSTKLQYQERKVMEIPRLEEQYLRTARSIVRQQEVANTMNKIEFKKVEEEVKNMNFFKTKAKFLEENVEKLKTEVENLTNQNRLSHSRYQALLIDFNKLKANKQNEEKKLKATINSQNSLNGLVGGQNSGKFRPSSAPAIRNCASATSLQQDSFSNKKTVNPEASDGAETEEDINMDSTVRNKNSNPKGSAGKTLFRQSAPSQHRHKRSMGSSYKSTEDLLNDEILKLHSEIQKKDQQILKMTKKLSLARAYPLLSTQDADDYELLRGEDSKSRATDSVGKGIAWDYDEAAMYAIKSTKGALNETAPTTGYLLGNNLHEMNYMLDEVESVSTAFRLEEEELQEARNRKAVELQLEFDDRFTKHRQSLPPHIAAIRNSKSFVKVLNDENII